MKNTPFDRAGWREMLERYFAAYRRWEDLDYRLAVAGPSPPAGLSAECDSLGRTLVDLRAEYRAGLPFVPLSRCPYSAQVVYHSLDPSGIEGLWWDYRAAIRPVENLPVTFHAITGAVRLDGPVADAPFLCIPGPGAPFVLPAVLSSDHITAVLSSIPIGDHTGYAILYFSDVDRSAVPRPDSWGTNRWELLDRAGTLRWGEWRYDEKEMDYDLAPWIAEGRLRWIRPGDRLLVLREGTDGCPYLDLKGTHRIQRVQNGRVLET